MTPRQKYREAERLAREADDDLIGQLTLALGDQFDGVGKRGSPPQIQMTTSQEEHAQGAKEQQFHQPELSQCPAPSAPEDRREQDGDHKHSRPNYLKRKGAFRRIRPSDQGGTKINERHDAEENGKQNGQEKQAAAKKSGQFRRGPRPRAVPSRPFPPQGKRRLSR